MVRPAATPARVALAKHSVPGMAPLYVNEERGRASAAARPETTDLIRLPQPAGLPAGNSGI